MPRPSLPAWADAAVVLLLSALPGLAAWAAFGVIQQPDTAGYLAYAAQIRAGAVPSGQALLHAGAIPISLFRAPGYPAFLAGLQLLFPKAWPAAGVALQIGLSAVVAAGVYLTAIRLGARRSLAMAAALLPAVGFIVVTQIALLTDALNTALFTGAALCLAASGGVPAALVAGVLLALTTTFREATPYLAVAFVPLAWWGGRRGLARVAATLLPPLCVVAALMAWNTARIGRPVVTTTAEINMVQPLFPLIRQGLPVYAGDDAFDRTARATVVRPDYAAMLQLLDRLYAQANMTAPDLAAAATQRYWRAWRQFPLAMAVSAARRFRTSFLALPFAPLDTIADLQVYSGRNSSLVKLGLLWRRAQGGDVGSLSLWLLVVITRTIGMAVAVVGIVAPWLPGRTWQARGLWMICAGVPLIYMPVHLDTRFMLPVVPLLCLAAALSVAPRRR